ncbi:MAG: exo-alpha-sialidase [Clostridia bacterium]|nr:exo-alpha-sialidase [Clostridia bacterium]
MKKILIILLALSMMAVAFALPSSAAGYYKSDLVFPTGGDSNFRIPMLVSGDNGALYAFCNDRQKSVSDYAEIQWLAYSKASDGVNFSEWEYLLKKDGWTYVIGSAVYDSINHNLMLVYYSTIVTDAAKAEYNAMSEQERANNPIGSAIIETKDGGVTWTKRGVKMPVTYEKPYGGASVHGAGTGVQLKNGEHAGRLVFPAKAGNSALASVKEMSERMVGTLIYSDDFGLTWKSSLNCMPFGTDETSICELSDGTLYITSRMISNTCGRYVAYSYDGGRSIKDKRIDETLEVQCQYGIRGAVTNIPNYDGKGNSLTLFSSLNSPVSERRNLAVWLSYDGGKTWADKVIIDGGWCSYSEIVYNPSTKLISIMYERGDISCFSSGIQISTFDLDWLLSKKQPNVPLRNTPVLDDSIKAELIEESLILNFGATLDAYKTADVGLKGNALNGRSAFDFGGIHGISVQNLSELMGNMTFFVVYKSSNNLPEDSSVLFQSTHAQGIRTYMSETSAALTTYVGNGIYNATEAQKFLDTDWHIMAVTWNGDSADTALLTQFLDGNTDLKYELGRSVARTTNKSGVVRIGYGFEGLIADVLVYNRALSDEEVAKTGLYLADLYGLSWQITEPEPVQEQEQPDEPEDNESIPSDNDTAEKETSASGEENKGGCGSTVACAAVATVTAVSAAAIFVKNKKQNRRKK